MKAKLTKEFDNGRNYGGEKETISNYNVVVVYKGEIKEPVTCRCYMGRSRQASTVYASVWISKTGFYTSGRGSAGGYGYHKESAAIGDALRSAGVELDQDIDGRGELAIEEALIAVVRALGYKGKVKVIR